MEKHYKEIAKMIALCRIYKTDVRYQDYETGINAACQDIAHRLMEYFESIDLQFNRKQFDDICFAD